MNLSKHIFFFSSLLILLGGCANMAQGPTGGKKDTESPKFVKSTPSPNEKNVNVKRIEIDFNEYVQITNPSQNLVVSPPQKSSPIAKALGKKIIVELKDSLRPNATYTLDFRNCIGDYTENNPVKNYCHTFSTGNELDTLTISGIVLNAENLKPAENVYVGIYSTQNDTMITSTPFERIGKTSEDGRFNIKGVAGKNYKIYALEDLNNNYYYDQAGEGIALQEMALPIPTVTTNYTYDTIFKDSITIDTIIAKKEVKYYPDSVILRLFHKEVKLQEFKKIVRNDRHAFSLYFQKIENSIPKIVPVNFTASKDWYIVETNKMADTITYWITDSTIYQKDSLTIATDYLITDSTGNLIHHPDTLIAHLTPKYIKDEEKKANDEELLRKKYEKRGKVKPRTNLIQMLSKNGSIEIDDSLIVWWNQPMAIIKDEMLHLSYKKDSSDISVPFKIQRRENQRAFYIDAEIIQGEKYTLEIDSAAIFDYYGNHNNKIKLNFNKKFEDEYGHIKLNISNFTGNIIVQLLNSSEEIIREVKSNEKKISFIHISPGTYFVKLIEDSNNNGKWDTGDNDNNRFPEQVYYFSKALKVRAGWGVEEDWNIKEKKIDNQRPSGLQSNKKKK